jgi:hypothetical protein
MANQFIKPFDRGGCVLWSHNRVNQKAGAAGAWAWQWVWLETGETNVKIRDRVIRDKRN